MAGVFEPSPVRKGLDLLLAFYPHFDLIKVEWQVEEEVTYLTDGETDLMLNWGPWVLVEMGQASEGKTHAWAIWRFAIWRTTGAVHTMNEGAVSDDPIFSPREG